MAKTKQSLGIVIPAEVNFARTVVERHGLRPPVDIEKLVRQHAELVYKPIPYDDIDGISVNLKVRGKRPRVIVNSHHAPIRQRFTLAHELGHIIIPWHVGSIIDHAEPSETFPESAYWKLEKEANSFAAEILIPEKWIQPLMLREDDLAQLHKTVAEKCETSALAAGIRIANVLPKNFVYASIKDGCVEFSGRTNGTLASPLDWGADFDEDSFDYCDKHYSATKGSRTFHWWRLPNEVFIKQTRDKRPWREILDDMLHDLRVPSAKVEKIKSTVNAIIAYANGVTKTTDNYCIESVGSACIQRFRGKQELKPFVQHKDFEVFIRKKLQELVRSKK